jgi:hypothetical protein
MGDYSDWIKFQKTAGGLPANFWGYLAMLLCRLIARHNLRDPKTIPGPYSDEGKFLNKESLPRWVHDPPIETSTNRWPVPQREYIVPSDDIKNAIESLTERFATENNLTKGTAFDSLNAYYLDGTEVFHRHPADYSHHIMLHPSDAKLSIIQGWGELFGLAGKVGQKLGCTLIFVPTNEEELKLLEKIMKAAVDFAKSGGK